MAAAMPPILNGQMGLGQAAVCARRSHRGGGFFGLAKGLHRHARRRRDVIVGMRRRRSCCSSDFGGRGCSFTCVAEFGLFGFGIGGRGRARPCDTSRMHRSPNRIGGRFGPRLHEIRRIVDHGREIALGGATEIVVRLVFVVAAVQDRWTEIFRPQSARAGDRRDLWIAQPDGRPAFGDRRDGSGAM